MIRRTAWLIALAASACATGSPPRDAAFEQERLGTAALEAQDHPAAAEHYRAALALLPADAAFDERRVGPLMGLGTTTGDPEEGVAAYEQALAIRASAPAHERAGIMMGLGARMRHAGRCEEALGVLEAPSRFCPPIAGATPGSSSTWRARTATAAASPARASSTRR